MLRPVEDMMKRMNSPDNKGDNGTEMPVTDVDWNKRWHFGNNSLCRWERSIADGTLGGGNRLSSCYYHYYLIISLSLLS